MKRTSQASDKNVTGERIRKARLRSKPSMSQNDLSGKLAVWGILLDQTAISRIEAHERYVMDYELAAIAKCLRVSVSSLYG